MDPPSRLRLRCRRGMRELDLVLGRFLDADYDALGETGRAAFERLVEHSDQELIDWLLGVSRPDDPALRSLLDALRRRA